MRTGTALLKLKLVLDRLDPRPAMLVRLLRLTALLGCCAAILTACGRKDQSAAASGQVVAHVGKDVVTVQELDNEFRLDNIPQDKQKDPDIIRRVLGELVLRKFLVQQAVAASLDREPGVLLEILRSREQVLESAYLNRKAAAKSPGRADIEQFIASNPSRFADRITFSVDEIGFVIGPETQSFLDANKDAKSLDEIDQRLTAAGVLHGRQMGLINSGDLSADFIASIEKRKSDDLFSIRAGPNEIFFKVIGEEERPLTGDAAANLARQLMRADAIKAEAGMAAYAAGIEAKYDGDFASIMQPTGTTGGSASNH